MCLSRVLYWRSVSGVCPAARLWHAQSLPFLLGGQHRHDSKRRCIAGTAASRCCAALQSEEQWWPPPMGQCQHGDASVESFLPMAGFQPSACAAACTWTVGDLHRTCCCRAKHTAPLQQRPCRRYCTMHQPHSACSDVAASRWQQVTPVGVQGKGYGSAHWYLWRAHRLLHPVQLSWLVTFWVIPQHALCLAWHHLQQLVDCPGQVWGGSWWPPPAAVVCSTHCVATTGRIQGHRSAWRCWQAAELGCRTKYVHPFGLYHATVLLLTRAPPLATTGHAGAS